ncbi:hypothetical protein QUB05_20005 [Microcoleus sp. F10-C6]|uniref:hypothetical protein n=1 Tax=unclassified Microcoleus TaxID=2642155 RepID=UPI002FD2E3DF
MLPPPLALWPSPQLLGNFVLSFEVLTRSKSVAVLTQTTFYHSCDRYTNLKMSHQVHDLDR